jgi:hypothetical protein
MENERMNGRIHNAITATKRIAAAARSIQTQMQKSLTSVEKLRDVPDYTDYEKKLDPWVRRELVIARIDQAKTDAAKDLTKTIMELAEELAEIEKELPSEYRL